MSRAENQEPCDARTAAAPGDGPKTVGVEPQATVELELSEQQMRAMVDGAMHRIVEFVRTLRQQPTHYTEDAAAAARALIEPLPETGEPFEALLARLFEDVIPHGYNAAAPGYFAYIPGGGIFHTAVADLIAESVNRYTSIWIPAPGLAQIETTVVRWLCEVVGYPPGSLGLLTTGGSMANFTALFTARREKLPQDFLSGTVYVSDQVHHSIAKAAMLAGFPPANVRSVATDGLFRMRRDDLLVRIGADRDAGLRPFLLVGSAGTVNTGAVDDMSMLAEVAAAESLWFHVDAAYGGLFMLTERGRETLSGIERSDSMSLDPHKGMFLPYGTGSLLVRDRETLARAHATEAGYLPSMQDDPDFVDFSEISPELSRGHRGLRAWLPIKMHGIGAFRRALDEKLDLTHWFTERLRALDGIEIIAEPELSLVAFRLLRPGLSDDELDVLNRRLLDEINARRRVFISHAVVRGAYVLRVCVLSFRTHEPDMQRALEDIRAAIDTLA